MIARYSRKEMARIWTEEYKFQKMLEVEIFACEILSKKGIIPENSLKNIKEKAKFDIVRIREIEEVVKHDVIAFLTAVGENIGEDSRFIHIGLTSSDVLDTAQGAILKESIKILRKDIIELLGIFKEKAIEYKMLPMIGRTHGIHAEPMTFGLKLALWYSDMERNLERLNEMEKRVAVGKISGAVGTFANLEPFVEEYVCEKMGIANAKISTQVLQRDRHAEYLTTLALIAGTVEKIATEFRNLQRTDIREIEESFSKGQKGSSAMPHKKNPITSEQLTGLARIIRSNSIAGLENIALWHERDISHSSVERIILPDSSILLDYILQKLKTIISNMIIYKENMNKNLSKTQGLFFSQRLMLSLVGKGISREKAYQLVQKNSLESWDTQNSLKELVLKDIDIMSILNEKELDEIFSLDYYLRNIDEIFKRVGIK
ncbi:MAG: adenylosuccinate lyase [Elusimicrobiota bacterium]|jgi:adenylosuccinate lyase|nr:adenylosuccinate lyase [Elusimicrobiota bacterium]